MPLSHRSLRTTFLTFTLLTLATTASAVVRTVALDGSADFIVIQDAIEASTAGDSVLVHPGTYTWSNQGSGDIYGMIRFWRDERDEVHLVSSGGAEVTILDAESQGRVFFCNGNNVASDPVDFLISGFTFRNGLAPLPPAPTSESPRSGGGVALHLCDATFLDCVFENNVADLGGGVWLGGVGVYEFHRCRFVGNRAEIIQFNQAPVGGGVLVFGPQDPEILDSALFSECTFVGNHADYRGGGMYTAQDHVRIENCLFDENTVSPSTGRNGTAIYAINSHQIEIDGTTVRDHVSAPGAAVYLLDYRFTEPTVVNIDTYARVSSTVISTGTGSGMNLSVEDIDDFDVSCTNLYGGFPGDWLGALLSPRKDIQGNLNVDPLFCSAWGDRRAVALSSPLLAAHNDCGADIGRILGRDCATVRLDDPGDSGPPPAARTTRLIGASPNPFNPRTTVRFELAEASHVRLDVYDARGRLVATLLDAPRGAGLHEEVFEGQRLGSGVYRLRLDTGERVRTGSMVLVR